MDEAELDYLGITDEQHRMKLMTAVDLLQDIASKIFKLWFSFYLFKNMHINL